MDCINPEFQQALAECRKAMADQLLYERGLQEENRQLREMLLMRQSPDVVMRYLQDRDGNRWKNECTAMQNSLSWRVTKPLRLVKKAIVTFRTMGWRYTIKKILGKL